MTITRRDFLNGIALTVGTGLSPLQMLGPALAGEYYPPLLTGLRGHHPGSFETAHTMGLDGEKYDASKLPVSETYDLVVVGGGISGLSAAWFYREKNPKARILILDNHDDFGGHAKRNEFNAGGRMILGYGGSEAFQSPNQLFGPETKQLMKGLGVDITRFESAFDRTFYSSLGLSRGVFFDADTFGNAKLVTGDPQPMVADDLTDATRNARPWKEFIADFPLSDTDRAALIELHESPRDYLPGKTVEEKVEILSKTSYHKFLISYAGLSETAAQFFRNRPCDFTAFCTDGFAAFDAYSIGYPGFGGMNLPPPDPEVVAEMEEPYIYHFPDGNAGLARMIVRSLVPDVALGNTMEDIVLAKFDYSRLDQPSNQVRIRLNSTAVDVRNTDSGTEVGYITAGKMTKVGAQKTILACFNMIIPHIFKELPETQSDALKRNVKLPLVYTKVILSNWQPFIKAGVHDIYCAARPYSRVKLDFPVDIGGYSFPRDPAQSVGLHMVYTPIPFGEDPETDGRDLARMGRGILLGMSFEEHEKMIRDQLTELLSRYGFNASTDIQAITVNRWSHGYSWTFNSLYEDEAEAEATIAEARKKLGNVAIANSDSDWAPYVPGAVSQAWRAVEELTT